MAQPGPNPQTNLIFSIVAPVVALIAITVLYFMKPTPLQPAPVSAVNVATAKLPDPGIQMVNALPNSGTSTNSAGGGSMSGGFGGKKGGAMGAMSMGGGPSGPTGGGGIPGPTLQGGMSAGGSKGGGKKGGAMGAS